MITFSGLNKNGRLGNQLFQLASTMGIAQRSQQDAAFPEWPYERYFPNLNLNNNVQNFPVITEPRLGYFPELFEDKKNIDIHGYLQCEKYFHTDTKRLFSFHPDFSQQCRDAAPPGVFGRQVIAIHVRRGDYKESPIHRVLPALYYLLALEEYFPNWRKCNLLFFGDDMEHVKFTFSGLSNAFFSEGLTDIADLCLMSQCDHFITANSTFSWWAAYLGEKEGTKVIYPKRYFKDNTKETSEYIYPAHWTAFDEEGMRLDLTDVTFTMPVAYDHSDRKENIELALAFILSAYDTNVIIGEQGGNKFAYLEKYCDYMQFDFPVFHRTRMLNEMARRAGTPYAANYDCDVLLQPAQILETVYRLREGVDVVLPYDGRFVRIGRHEYAGLAETLELTPLTSQEIGKAFGSVGGCVFVDVKSFFLAGGENENFISHAPEDVERIHRFKLLGLKVERVNGALLHIEHYIGENSNSNNRFRKHNFAEFDKVKAMTEEQLRNYVKTWTWAKA